RTRTEEPPPKRSLTMFRTVLNAIRSVTRTSTGANPQKTQLRIEGLEERTCPTTIQQFAAVLGNQILADTNRFVHDAAIIEYYAPTLMAHKIDQDLIQINNDARANAIAHVFGDFQTLVQDMAQEVAYTQYYYLPARIALA